MASEVLDASARAFLPRAQDRLVERAPECLLYAALELRLGVEARYHEYLDAAEEVTTLKKRGWQVAHLAKGLERAFKLGNKIVSLTLLDADATAQTTFYYTPVPRRTRQIAERLGDCLHFTPRFRPTKEAWRKSLRELIEEGIAGLQIATTGTLLAPPMYHDGTKEGMILVEVPAGTSFEVARTMLGAPGGQIRFRIDYHDVLPDSHAG